MSMYQFDGDFRPRGRVFMKAQRENLTPTSSELVRRGSAITTNLDDRNIKFRHDVIHEKTVEAVITDYPRDSRNASTRDVVDGRSNALVLSVPVRGGSSTTDLHEIVRNKRLSTEVLGSTLETTKTSQRNSEGHRRHVTHIVRKVTTLSRAEEKEHANNMIKFSNDKKTTALNFMTTQAIEPKRVKVFFVIILM